MDERWWPSLKIILGASEDKCSIYITGSGHYDYKGDTYWKDWPRSPTRLSTELSRLSKPLAALNIRCLTKVDRRQEGGTQKDVVIEYVLKSKKKVEEQPQAKTSWSRI